MIKKFMVDSPKLPRKTGIVQYPTSYEYNGGIIIDGEWFSGYDVGLPIIPDGYELKGIGIGYQLNARPPIATGYLSKIQK